MSKICILITICMISACSVVPPKPPSCEGEFHPVNIPQGGSQDG